MFNFKLQCFYCEKECKSDSKNPSRKNYQEVRTIHSGIRKRTLLICNKRSDSQAKDVEKRLLSVIDLVAAEAKYHTKCRVYFERENDKYPTSTHEHSMPD